MNMKVEEAFHMVGGVGETSYATNSRLQEIAIFRAKLIVEEAVAEVFGSLLPDVLVAADLGCSSGPNTFLVMSEVIDAVGSSCRRLGRRPSELQFFLNDLPGNDFNTIFQSLAQYNTRVRDEIEEKLVPYYVAGLPGTFYGRLFPSKSVHFFHSSYCLMWLSQVPQGLEMGVPLNKGNIYIANTSPDSVIKLYWEQYQRDFYKFLNLRSKEIILGGRIVLTFLGRNGLHPTSAGQCYLWGLLAEALNDMMCMGLVEETVLNKFNLPYYAPSIKEVKAVIQNEGSFDLDKVEIFESNWDPFDDSNDDNLFDNFISGENVAKCLRAVIEPILAHHFGEAIMDDLFSRYAKNIARHLFKEKTKYVIFTISLKTRVNNNY